MEWIRGEIIGRGSFGTIHLAELTKSNRFQTSVIVKSCHIANSSSLKNEKEILTKLGNSHPNIIKYLGNSTSVERGVEFYNLFLEYASKGSLADCIRISEGKFGIFEIKRCTKSLLNGLFYIHENGFVHCDVKLQNILVFENDEVKIADFGLSRKGDAENYDGQVTGTPLYMSPEIVAGGKVTTAAGDIWAVGCAVVEMVTGKSVWECLPANDVSGLFYRIGVCGEIPKIPGQLCDDGKDFLRKCFLKDPNERWTARMLLDHPFLSGVDKSDLVSKCFVSPKCPFDFPDWESTDGLSFGPGSTQSIGSLCDFEVGDFSCCGSILSRLDGELISERVPEWSDSDGWVTIR